MRPNALHRLAQYDQNNKKPLKSVFPIYKRLVRYVLPHKKIVLLAILVVCISSMLSFVIPQATRIIIDDVIPKSLYSWLPWIAVGVTGTALLLGLFNFLGTYTMSLIGQRTIFDIRNDIYYHMQDLSLSFFENRRTGELMSRVTNDVNTLQNLITSGVVEIFKDMLVFAVVFGYLMYADWQLTLLLSITFPLMIYTTKFFARRIRGAYREVQTQLANVNDHLQDTLSSMKLIKSFSNEDYEKQRFESRNEKSMHANINAVKLSATYGPVIDQFNYLGLVLILVFGSWRAIEAQLTPGELVLFLTYMRMLQQPIRRFTRIINIVQQSAAASERIFEIIDTKAEVTEKENAIELPKLKGHIRMDHVHFHYNEQSPVLQNFSLEIKPGETVALVGASGAGKSTVANLLIRFYDPQQGTISFDDYDIRDVTLKSLRGQMGIVSQEILLLNGTVRENIAYGKPDASDEEIEAAAKLANAHEFISSLPKGYDSEVGERGIKLSGGQRQRLSIARALLKDPRVLILDEATSSLDTESEHLIQEALNTLLAGRSSLVIAHRLSTIQNADKIVVMHEGDIVEIGTHDELLQKKGRYAQLYALQFPKEVGAGE